MRIHFKIQEYILGSKFDGRVVTKVLALLETSKLALK